VLCIAAGGWLHGDTILPELIRQNRDEYCEALQEAHTSFEKTGTPDLKHLHELVTRLLNEQFKASPQPNTPAGENAVAALPTPDPTSGGKA
jgi:hypothetical protein